MATALITFDAIQTTGRKAFSQMFGPNVVLYSGTFDMNGATTATIDLTDVANVPTAVSSVLAGNVWVTSGVSDSPAWEQNANGAGAATPGNIGITIVANNTDTGFWTALCVLGA